MCSSGGERSGVPFVNAGLHGVWVLLQRSLLEAASPEPGCTCYSERMEMGITLDVHCSVLHDFMGNSPAITPRLPGPLMGYDVEPQVLPVFLAYAVVMPSVW